MSNRMTNGVICRATRRGAAPAIVNQISEQTHDIALFVDIDIERGG